MTDKLFKDDIIDNIKLFSDLKTQTEFSTISKELSSKFKDFTFSRFYTNLKNYKKKLKICNINTIFSLASRPKKNKILNDKEFDVSKIKLAIQKMKERDDESKQKIDHPYTERLKHSIQNYTLLKDKARSKEREKIRYINKYNNISKSSTPEIGRYNPSYELIKKRTHEVIFSLKNYEEFNQEFKEKLRNIKNKKLENNTVTNISNRSQKIFKKYLNIIQKENKNKTIQSANSQKTQFFFYKTIRDKINNEEKTNNNIFYNTAISKKNKKLNDKRNNIKNSHCLKFETYYPRNHLIIPKFYKTETNFNTSSFRTTKLKKNVIFGKIYSNKINYFEELAEQKKDIPSIGFYRPDYSLVSNRTKNIFFDKKKSLKNNIKINKLRKILGSYYVKGEYQLFNLLNDKHGLSNEKIN